MSALIAFFEDSLRLKLGKLSRELDCWRHSAQRGRRIPESLWQRAVNLARIHGVSPISAALRLSYYDLQARAQGEHALSTARPTPPTFVELPAPKGNTVLGPPGTVEVVHGCGARLLLRLPQGKPEDLLALVRAFLDWRP